MYGSIDLESWLLSTEETIRLCLPSTNLLIYAKVKATGFTLSP